MTDTALVVAGHGSHRNPDSAAPVYAHAATARERVDVPVREAFWKESPSLRDAVRTLDAAEAVLVPLFVSEGYFTEGVLPREVGLGAAERPALDGDGTAPVTVTQTPPVGTHPRMRAVILDLVERLYGPPDGDVGLALVGHGTERDDQSSRAVETHAAALAEESPLGAVEVAFMDEDPGVAGVVERFDTSAVVVVPLFVADGFHTRDEIPELLGVVDDPDDQVPVPADVDGTAVYYTSAVGTDPRVAAVVLERAAEAGISVGPPPGDDVEGAASSRPSPPVREAAGAAFLEWIGDGPSGEHGDPQRRFGELTIRATGGGYELRHHEDRRAPAGALDRVGVDDLRATVRTDDAGRYRPFTGERSLPTGWRCVADTGGACLRAVTAVYPVAVDDWYLSRVEALDPVSWSAVAERQTGIYASVSDLDATEVDRAAAAVCGNCTKCPAWRDREATGDGTIPCREPCSFLVAAARAFPAGDDGGAATEVDPTVDRGDLGREGNRYRVRHRRTAATPVPGEEP